MNEEGLKNLYDAIYVKAGEDYIKAKTYLITHKKTPRNKITYPSMEYTCKECSAFLGEVMTEELDKYCWGLYDNG